MAPMIVLTAPTVSPCTPSRAIVSSELTPEKGVRILPVMYPPSAYEPTMVRKAKMASSIAAKVPKPPRGSAETDPKPNAAVKPENTTVVPAAIAAPAKIAGQSMMWAGAAASVLSTMTILLNADQGRKGSPSR